MNYIKSFNILFLNLFIVTHLFGIEITWLTCDFKESPAGIINDPIFGWVLSSVNRDEVQTAYHILVSDDLTLLESGTGNMWDTKKINSGQSINLHYRGSKLKSTSRYYWKVKVWDSKNKESAWSNTASFLTGITDSNDWCDAQWIGYEELDDRDRLVPGVQAWGHDLSMYQLNRPVIPYFRKIFQNDKALKSAYLYISGLGQYEATLNGEKISADFLSPGWTFYEKTCLYNTYDITSQLKKGENVLGIIAGNGMHYINKERYKKFVIAFGMPKMKCLLKIKYTDGTEKNIISDEDWKTHPSPITFSSIYGGEDYDATMEISGWNKIGFDDSHWKNAISVKDPGGKLIPEITYPIRVMEYFDPVTASMLSPDTFIYDFGQNASGIFKITVKGKKGDRVKLIPGELLKNDGSVSQRATGGPHYYEYTLKGDSIETWQPKFTYYGFRYIQIEGASPDSLGNDHNSPVMINIRMLRTRNSSPFTGSFSCSNDLLNQIFRLIDYAIKSNYQSVITDCPHREKLGWLEQTYLMGGSIHYNYHVYHIFQKIVHDMIDAQRSNGLIPGIAPEFVDFTGGFLDSPEWGSAGIILPWLIYKWYGDQSAIQEAWPMMKDYIKYLTEKSDKFVLAYGLGDWYDHGSEKPGVSQLTPLGITATSTFYYDVKLMSEMAHILDKPSMQLKFERLADTIKDAFNQKYFDCETNVYASGSQTAMAMPLCLGLVDEQYQEKVFKNLIDSINKNNKELTAGDIGFHYLIETLTNGGESQLIYEMNNRDDIPGYGFQLKKGATSLTESWDALPMVSNNHLMLGHLMQWFYEGLGGINQNDRSIAYENITIKPKFVDDLTHVKAIYNSPYGKISSEWTRNNREIILILNIPVNTSACIYLPAKPETMKENNKEITKFKGLHNVNNENGQIILNIGSGLYTFTFELL